MTIFLKSLCAVMLAACSPLTFAVPFSESGPAQNGIDTDPSTIVSFTATQTGLITDLNLEIGITTPYADDVDIFLRHLGVTVHVYDAIGDTESSFIDAIFDDEAGSSYPANGTVDGTYQPAPDALSSFDGLQLSGLWELILEDTIEPDDGTNLSDWRIFGTVAVAAPEPPTLALMGLGLAGIGFSRKRKAK